MTQELDERADELARAIVADAKEHGLTVSTAESLTAGMTASYIADIPGASDVLRGGAVTYCDEIKHRVLGVKQETLDEHTAVSHETAREMALGSRELFQTDVSVSLTGFAGPDWGTEENPAGTVYIGVATAAGVESHRCHFEGGRNDVRKAAAVQALEYMHAEIVKSR